jgi:hypothetical protein
VAAALSFELVQSGDTAHPVSLVGRYTATVAGRYDLAVRFVHAAFSLTVYNVLVTAGSISATHSTAEVPTTTLAGPLQFPIYAADRYGNALTSGDDVFAVRLTGAASMTADDVQWTAPHYTVSTTVAVAGQYQVRSLIQTLSLRARYTPRSRVMLPTTHQGTPATPSFDGGWCWVPR